MFNRILKSNDWEESFSNVRGRISKICQIFENLCKFLTYERKQEKIILILCICHTFKMFV